MNLNKDILNTRAYIYEEYKYLLTDKTNFFVEEPNISFDGVSNLGNIIKVILYLDYKIGSFKNTFMAINKRFK